MLKLRLLALEQAHPIRNTKRDFGEPCSYSHGYAAEKEAHSVILDEYFSESGQGAYTNW